MNSESKKTLEFDESNSDSEIKEEKWLDLLVNVIICYPSSEHREKKLLKFLIFWIEDTISCKKGKEDVGKFEKALELLKDHAEIIMNRIHEAKIYERLTSGTYDYHDKYVGIEKDKDSSDSE
jgi:hypothetical protein